MKPAAPVAPVAPVLPVAPVAPVTPITPCAPVAPVLPVAPVAPVAPVGPVGPGTTRLAVTKHHQILIMKRKVTALIEPPTREGTRNEPADPPNE